MGENQRSSERVNLLDLQSKFAPAIESEGHNVNELAREIKKLRILVFDLDREKHRNIVSWCERRIVFVESDYIGQVAIGDVWLCSLVEYGNVYYATPLKKITAATAMDFSEEMRAQIIDGLWNANKNYYKKEFEQKYRDEVYKKAIEESDSKYSDIIETQKRKIEDLTNQLNQSMVVLESRHLDSQNYEEEEVLLGFDEPTAPAEAAEDEDEVLLGTSIEIPAVRETHAPPALFTENVQGAPGLPEMPSPANVRRQETSAKEVHVERIDANTLYSDSFPDGKYFVHINMSKKFLLIRFNPFGQVVCVNHRMVLDGLGDISSFASPKKLVSQMNQRYDGLLVYL